MLAILTSHPIQYQAPLWRALAEEARVPFEVWFLTDHAVKPTHDREFGKSFAWDRDLLEGYPFRFLPVGPGWRMDRFRGIKVTESWAVLFKRHGVTHLWVEGWRFWENWAAIFAARRAGIEVWLRGETNDLRKRQGGREWVRRILLGALFRRVRYFLCIGSANRRFYQSFGIADERLLFAPYCVDNAWFAARAEEIRGQNAEDGGRAGLPGQPTCPQRGEMQMGRDGGRAGLPGQPTCPQRGEVQMGRDDVRTEIRRQWGIAEDAFCLLFCGKFIPKKRPLDVVMAARRVIQAMPGGKPHLLFVGAGALGDELREACRVVFDAEATEDGSWIVDHGSKSLGDPSAPRADGDKSADRAGSTLPLITDSRPISSLPISNQQSTIHNPQSLPLPTATFAGFLNQGEIIRAYVAADCLVLPSDTGETWGLVVNEAMATGLPCLVSDQCGSAGDLVRPLSEDAVYPTGDVSALALAISSMMKCPPARGELLQWIDRFSFQPTVDAAALAYHGPKN
jgi:glycosyltransferase involved in cell wall biosynthesis